MGKAKLTITERIERGMSVAPLSWREGFGIYGVGLVVLVVIAVALFAVVGWLFF